jgi:hypothetical protein
VPAFNQEAEEHANAVLKFEPAWVMDGDNQRVVIDAFFESVMPQESLVFMSLKHSPGRRSPASAPAER